MYGVVSKYYQGEFQLILNPIRDWNLTAFPLMNSLKLFQLILNPIRDWNNYLNREKLAFYLFQLILNPIRDWNHCIVFGDTHLLKSSN